MKQYIMDSLNGEVYYGVIVLQENNSAYLQWFLIIDRNGKRIDTLCTNQVYRYDIYDETDTQLRIVIENGSLSDTYNVTKITEEMVPTL